MPATREQLLARWETTEGQQLAELVRLALDPVLFGSNGSWQAGPQPLETTLVQQLAHLPFADEIASQIDLRGLHVQDKTLDLKYTDLSNVRLDYAYEIDRIIHCKTAGAVLDGSRSINGMFTRDALNGISLVGASFNGGMFQDTNLSGANLQGAHLVVTDFSRANCTGASFVGADMRFANVHLANFSGADLREVDLTEANMGRIIFDTQTLLQGANLRGALLSPDFRTFAEQAGAQLSDGETFSTKHLVELNATISVLQANNVDGHLDDAIVLVSSERDQLARNPQYEVFMALEEAFDQASSPPWVDEVMETWSETTKALAYYV